MSIKLMSKVFGDKTLNPTRKLIMLSLADNANDEGFCYPSITTICKKTSLSKPTVINNIKTLVEENYILNKKRTRKNGSATSKIYVIYPSENLSKLDEEIRERFKDNKKDGSKTALPHSKTALPHSKTALPHSKTALPHKGHQSKTALPLEPSLTINHHYKPNLIPKDILTNYKNLISSSRAKLKESSSFKELTSQKHKDNWERIIKGIHNYSIKIKQENTNEKYISSLHNFIKDSIYLDYQETPEKVKYEDDNRRQVW